MHYSLSFPDNEHARHALIWQFGVSIGSLRRVSPAVPVALFVHGAAAPQIAEVCRAHDVTLVEAGPYERRLRELCPAGGVPLSRHPLLHKLLNFSALSASAFSHILYSDVDTVFFRDVCELQTRYGAEDLVAREEVHSGRSHHGADLTFINEPLLLELCRHEQAAWVPPINTGVLLFRRETVRALAELEGVFVDYAWRFLTWEAINPATGIAAAYGELEAASLARSYVRHVDTTRALPFPSANRWLLDEVAFWLTLGHLPGLRVADFSRVDVAQGGEYFLDGRPQQDPVVFHYFSQNTQAVHDWLLGRSAPAAHI